MVKSIRQPCFDLLDLLVIVEQQTRGVPLAREERVARVAGCETAYVRAPTASCCRSRSSVSASDRRLGRAAMISATSLAARGDTRQADRGRVAEEDLAERLADDGAECHGAGAPAARARATSRSRNSR